MALTVLTAKITGNPGESGWAQVHEFRPQDTEKLSKRGELLAVIATSKKGEFFGYTPTPGEIPTPGGIGEPGSEIDSVLAGRELISRLHEEYFGELEKPAFNALKEAIEAVMKEFFSAWGGVEIAAASYCGDVVYSAVSGGAEAAVFRDGMVAKILTSQASADAVSASGYPKDGDIFILGTSKFFGILPHGVIKAAFEGGSPEQASEALAPFIHARANTGSVGAAIMKFEKKEAFVSKIETGVSIEEPNQEVAIPKESSTLAPRGAFLKINPILKKGAEMITGTIGRFLPERRITVKGVPADLSSGQNRRLAISVGIILLVLLLVSIGFGIKQSGQKKAREKYESRLSQARHDISEAEKLYSLDPSRARELFASAENLTAQIENEGVTDKEVSDLRQEINDKESSILGIYRVTPELYIDLSLLSAGLKGDDISAGLTRLFVLDRIGKKVVGVDFDTKKVSVVAGPDQISSANYLANFENKVYVVGDGIVEVGDKQKKVIEKNWEGEVLPYSYSGNIYLIDKSAKTIWRYPASAEGFGERTKWNTNEIDMNFSDLAGVTIDGSIWLLTNSGEILRFSLGNQVAFSIKGLIPELTSGASIYSNEELKYVYILDRVGKRIIVIDKTGEYKAQYKSDMISEAYDLAVSESAKEIVLLAGDKLYSIEIKHLE